MDTEFTLTGTLVDAAGGPLPGLFLAIVDEDLLDADDLLGMGVTDPDGSFKLSFLRSEFQQDLFEDEQTPGIKITVSAPFDGVNKAVFQRSFPNLDWAGARVDLGRVEVEGYDPAAPVALAGVEATPGYGKRAIRLKIDDEMIRHCLAEVGPIVEKLTGWSDLLDGVNVDVCDGLSSYSLRDTFAAQGIDPASIEGKITTFMAEYGQASGAGCALYDPGTHTIAINRPIMEQVSLEGLKVMVGHELVHLGQFKYTPGLREYNRAMVLGMDLDPEKVDLEELKKKLSYMADLEGYATYIQTDFLQKFYYPMTIFPYHQSLLDSVIRSAVAMLLPNAEQQQEFKASQYTDGRTIYREAQVGESAARWTFDVATLPGGAEFVAAAQGG